MIIGRARERRRVAPLLSEFVVASREVDYFLYVRVLVFFGHQVLDLALPVNAGLKVISKRITTMTRRGPETQTPRVISSDPVVFEYIGFIFRKQELPLDADKSTNPVALDVGIKLCLLN